MKIFQLIIVLCLVIFSYQNCDGNTKKEDCKLSDTDKDNDLAYCCFVEDGDAKYCHGITKYQYKHLKDYGKLKLLTGDVKNEDVKIDCKSFYLQIKIISILLLLLF